MAPEGAPRLSRLSRGRGSGTRPGALIEAGLPTEALLALFAVAKYADGLPLYRQEATTGATASSSTAPCWPAGWAGLGFHIEPLADRALQPARTLVTLHETARLLCVFCLVAWRVFWMTIVHRSAPDADLGVALTPVEMQTLDRMVPNTKADRSSRPTLSTCLTKLARLGGYLARGKDPPPGNTVM